MKDKDPKSVQRTMFITGATSDIGRAIAVMFAEQGWAVIGHYHSSADTAREVLGAVEHFGVPCSMWKADLSSEKQVAQLVGKLGNVRIDSLVNNAGTYTVSKHFTELSSPDIRATFAVNTIAPMLISSAVFSQMKERRFGRIVNISSIAAKYGGSPRSMHYGCSKRALEGITKTLAREGAAHNVLVNTIRPGVIDTEFHKKFPKDMASRTKLIPVKHIGLPRDIADVAYYLGSDRNKFITNEIIAVAGGE